MTVSIALDYAIARGDIGLRHMFLIDHYAAIHSLDSDVPAFDGLGGIERLERAFHRAARLPRNRG